MSQSQKDDRDGDRGGERERERAREREREREGGYDSSEYTFALGEVSDLGFPGRTGTLN